MTKRKSIFLVAFMILQLCLIWPIYPLFSGTYPMIWGLPLSFAWIIFTLLGCFSLLLWYYLSDPELKNNPSEK